MSDPLTDIIAMSNDKEIVEDAVAKKMQRKRKRRYESSHTDTDDEDDPDPDTDPETDTEDDATESRGGYSLTESKSKGKVNKKLLNRELHNNKLRQISIPIPSLGPPNEMIKRTPKNDLSDRYFDFNASEYVDPNPKDPPQTNVRPLYKNPEFLKHVLIGIIIVLLFAWLMLKAFRFIKRKYYERKASQLSPLESSEPIPKYDFKEDDTKVYSMNFDDKDIDVKKDMQNIRKEIKPSISNFRGHDSTSNSRGMQSNNSVMRGGKNTPPRDSKGRFMKRK